MCGDLIMMCVDRCVTRWPGEQISTLGVSLPGRNVSVTLQKTTLAHSWFSRDFLGGNSMMQLYTVGPKRKLSTVNLA